MCTKALGHTCLVRLWDLYHWRSLRLHIYQCNSRQIYFNLVSVYGNRLYDLRMPSGSIFHTFMIIYCYGKIRKLH